MIKLVAIDLDGTLLDDSWRIPGENIKAIRQAADRGVSIVICSGRVFAGASLYARQLGIDDVIISCNGALVRDVKTGRILQSTPLALETADAVIDLCRSYNVHFYTYVGDSMYAEKLDITTLYYWEHNKLLDEGDRLDIRIVDSLCEAHRQSPVLPSKLVVESKDPDALSAIRERVNCINNICIVSSLHDNFEIMSRGVSKGAALKQLAESMNIQREEIMAIGDNENDLTMLEYSGTSVAMGNASDLIKSTAAHITLSNNEAGVAEAIKRFVL